MTIKNISINRKLYQYNSANLIADNISDSVKNILGLPDEDSNKFNIIVFV